MALLLDGEVRDEVNTGANVQIVLDKSPFYAESGGQVGDRGYISGENSLVSINDC